MKRKAPASRPDSRKARSPGCRPSPSQERRKLWPRASPVALMHWWQNQDLSPQEGRFAGVLASPRACEDVLFFLRHHRAALGCCQRNWCHRVEVWCSAGAGAPWTGSPEKSPRSPSPSLEAFAPPTHLSVMTSPAPGGRTDPDPPLGDLSLPFKGQDLPLHLRENFTRTMGDIYHC